MDRRVLLKLSGEYLAGELVDQDNFGPVISSFSHYNYEIVEHIVSQIVSAVKEGVEVSIVVGGGNFWRGSEAPTEFNRVKADNMGMLASVMNGIFLADRFISSGLKAHVMTPFAVGGMTELYNQDIADGYLKQKNTVVIFSGGTGQPYFSTDTISIIRGKDLNVDCVLFAKDVEGVCDKDPNMLGEEEDYTIYREITPSEMVAKRLKVVDVASMVLAEELGVSSVLFDIRVQNAIYIALTGDKLLKGFSTKISV